VSAKIVSHGKYPDTRRRAGWGVFSGANGDSPNLEAVYFGPRAKELAELLVELVDEPEDHDGDDHVIFDGCVWPVLVDHEGLHEADGFDEDEAIAALAERSGLAISAWQEPPEHPER
jgi:hypothetical protein